MSTKKIKTIILACLAVLAWQGFSWAQKQDLTACAAATQKSAPGLKVLESRADRIILQWTASPLEIVRDPESDAVTEVRMGSLEMNYTPGVIGLPQAAEVFEALPGNVTVSLIESEFQSLDLGSCLPSPEDFILDARSGSSEEELSAFSPTARLSVPERRRLTEKVAETRPRQVADVHEAGIFRGHRLMSLLLSPVQVNTETGLGRVLTRATVQVLLPNSQNNETRLPDSYKEHETLRGMLGKLADTALPTRAREDREPREGRELDDDFPVFNVNRWRIYVQESAIVKLTGEYLRTMGVPVGDITPWDLHIWNKGHEIPIVVEGQEDGHFDDFDYILFFGERNDRTFVDRIPSLWQDPYSLQNCYQLFWGDGRAGMRMGEISGTWRSADGVVLTRSVRSKLHFERDRYFDRLSDVSDVLGADIYDVAPVDLIYDNWFWGERIDALTSRDFEAYLPFPNQNAPFSFEPVVVRACLTGFSSSIQGNHYVTVSLNGLTDNGLSAGRQYAGDPVPAWTGQSPVIFETNQTDNVENILTSDLINGNNLITVTVPGNEISGNGDKVLANWFEVEYERDLRARADEFRFDYTLSVNDTVFPGDSIGYDIRGFSSPDIQVWKLGHSRLVNLETRRVTPADESASWAVRFPYVYDGPQDVLVFGESSIRQPFLMVPDSIQIDLRNQPGAEYVLVVYDPYYADSSIHILDSLRRLNFNNSVLTVPLSEVYEQFSGGLITPYAVRDFMVYAYDHWAVRPTHLCLVGDAVVVQRENSVPGNQIPTFGVPTYQYGTSTTDYLFGCVSGPHWDIIPDIAVGRISCRTPQELGTYVQKILLYESQPDYENLTASNVLMVADYYDSDLKLDFVSGFSEQSVRQMVDNSTVNLSRVYLDSIPSGQGPIALRDAIRDGCVAVNYNGHGGGGVWSGSSLINVGGVRLLNNRESFPFITNFTCYVGAFDDRSQAAVLGEAFIFARNNNNDIVGAIGVYSSSGVGWAIAGASMQRRLYDFMLTQPAKTLGEVAMLNKGRWWSSLNISMGWNSSMSMMMMMNLLGDPGVELKIPQQEFQPRIFGESNVVSPHDTAGAESLRVVMTIPWPQDGSTETYTYVLPYNGELFPPTPQGRTQRFTKHAPASTVDQFDVQFFNTQTCTTDAVPLNRLISREGDVVVYITNPVLKRNAVGHFPIYLVDSLEAVQITDIEAVPDSVAFSGEAFRVQAQILHEDDIQSVRFRGLYTPPQGPVRLDTMSMNETAPNIYTTVRDIGPYEFNGATYRVKFFVTPVGQEEYESGYFDLPLERTPDLSITFNLSTGPRERGGNRPYYYQPFTVQRTGSTIPLDNVVIRLTATQDTTIIEGGDTTVVMLDSFTVDHALPDLAFGEFEREAWIPTEFRPGKWNVVVTMDPDNLIRETRETNNKRSFSLTIPSYYPVARPVGTYLPRPMTVTPHKYWSIAARDTLQVRVPPGVLPRDSAAIGYKQPTGLSQAQLNELAQIGLYRPFTQSSHGVFSALFDDSLGTLGPEFHATVTLDIQGRDTLRSRVPTNTYAIYARDPVLNQWVRSRNTLVSRVPVDTTVFSNPSNPTLDSIVTWQLRVTGEVPTLGELAIFRVEDVTGPQIEVSIGGLSYTQGAIVPANPQIFVTYRDVAGVMRNDTSFYLSLDGDTVSPSLIAWNDSVLTAGSFTAMTEPDLEPGNHVLHVAAKDNHGNVSEYDAEFDVRKDFGFEWAINYPNPFEKNTTIAFVLTGVTNDFTEAKIYTVSGRLIKTLRERERATVNYRTLQWDGRDEDGEEVANGVYFARIVAKNGDDEIETTVKLAKVRR
ncbi:MAG: T9SS type A sorting domain-containing protein [Calditrichaeota bacterium]|nr:T9SS type A sorting domain-containing protein [Calditrichota bacterium]MCB9365709.1 T9SS type A sorting domain-containing protein [Calditrichota bacterium]